MKQFVFNQDTLNSTKLNELFNLEGGTKQQVDNFKHFMNDYNLENEDSSENEDDSENEHNAYIQEGGARRSWNEQLREVEKNSALNAHNIGRETRNFGRDLAYVAKQPVNVASYITEIPRRTASNIYKGYKQQKSEDIEEKYKQIENITSIQQNIYAPSDKINKKIVSLIKDRNSKIDSFMKTFVKMNESKSATESSKLSKSTKEITSKVEEINLAIESLTCLIYNKIEIGDVVCFYTDLDKNPISLNKGDEFYKLYNQKKDQPPENFYVLYPEPVPQTSWRKFSSFYQRITPSDDDDFEKLCKNYFTYMPEFPINNYLFTHDYKPYPSYPTPPGPSGARMQPMDVTVPPGVNIGDTFNFLTTDGQQMRVVANVPAGHNMRVNTFEGWLAAYSATQPNVLANVLGNTEEVKFNINISEPDIEQKLQSGIQNKIESHLTTPIQGGGAGKPPLDGELEVELTKSTLSRELAYNPNTIKLFSYYADILQLIPIYVNILLFVFKKFDDYFRKLFDPATTNNDFFNIGLVEDIKDHYVIIKTNTNKMRIPARNILHKIIQNEQGEKIKKHLEQLDGVVERAEHGMSGKSGESGESGESDIEINSTVLSEIVKFFKESKKNDIINELPTLYDDLTSQKKGGMIGGVVSTDAATASADASAPPTDVPTAAPPATAPPATATGIVPDAGKVDGASESASTDEPATLSPPAPATANEPSSLGDSPSLDDPLASATSEVAAPPPPAASAAATAIVPDASEVAAPPPAASAAATAPATAIVPDADELDGASESASTDEPATLSPPATTSSDNEYFINLKKFYYLIHIYIYTGFFNDANIHEETLMKIENKPPNDLISQINAEPSYKDFSKQFSNEMNDYFQKLLSDDKKNKRIIILISDNINRIKLYLIYISLLFNKIIYNPNVNSEEAEGSQQTHEEELKNKITVLSQMPQNRINALKSHFIIFAKKYITSILINLDKYKDSFSDIMVKIDNDSNSNAFILDGISQIMNEEQQIDLDSDYLYKLFSNYLLKNTPLDVIKSREEEETLTKLLMSNKDIAKFHREIKSCTSMAEVYQIVKAYLGNSVEITKNGILFKILKIPNTKEQDKKYYSKVINSIHSEIKDLEISETSSDFVSSQLISLKDSIKSLKSQIDKL